LCTNSLLFVETRMPSDAEGPPELPDPNREDYVDKVLDNFYDKSHRGRRISQGQVRISLCHYVLVLDARF
jgi:hypothetical protein